MTVEELLQSIYDLPIGVFVRESTWGFPTVGWVHVYCMIVFVSLIVAMDLRLMGFSLLQPAPLPLDQFVTRNLRRAWLVLCCSAISGFTLFTGQAPEYMINPAFRAKAVLLLTGLGFQTLVIPAIARREPRGAPSWRGKLAAAASIAIWIGVIAAARWIAYR